MEKTVCDGRASCAVGGLDIASGGEMRGRGSIREISGLYSDMS